MENRLLVPCTLTSFVISDTVDCNNIGPETMWLVENDSTNSSYSRK